MIKHGVKPAALDKRDYSYHRTFGTIAPAALPAEFDLDANLYPMPDQNLPNDFFGGPALPYGCTDYTVNELCTDEDAVPYSPFFTESKTHANALGGTDMRTPLASVCSDGVQAKGETTDAQAATHKRSAYFRIGQNPDYFDGIRTAISANGRPASIGTPWFPEWTAEAEQPGTQGIMPMPASLTNIDDLPWHCYKISGWTIINGITYLKCKVWQGPNFGWSGWTFLSREVLNAVMTIAGTAAFTLAKATPSQIATVGINYVFQKNLDLGQIDPDVAHLQEALQSLGYTIVNAVTTTFGSETKAALAKFQASQNIIDDGSHFGPLTRYAMNKILNPAQTLFGSIKLFIQTYLGIW